MNNSAPHETLPEAVSTETAIPHDVSAHDVAGLAVENIVAKPHTELSAADLVGAARAAVQGAKALHIPPKEAIKELGEVYPPVQKLTDALRRQEILNSVHRRYLQRQREGLLVRGRLTRG